MFSPYSPHVPPQILDLRCEFDVPRFFDLTQINPVDGPIFVGSDLQDEQIRYRTLYQDLINDVWFNYEHEFEVKSSAFDEKKLRITLLNLGSQI